MEQQTIRIKYHSNEIEKLTYMTERVTGSIFAQQNTLY